MPRAAGALVRTRKMCQRKVPFGVEELALFIPAVENKPVLACKHSTPGEARDL